MTIGHVGSLEHGSCASCLIRAMRLPWTVANSSRAWYIFTTEFPTGKPPLMSTVVRVDLKLTSELVLGCHIEPKRRVQQKEIPIKALVFVGFYVFSAGVFSAIG